MGIDEPHHLAGAGRAPLEGRRHAAQDQRLGVDTPLPTEPPSGVGARSEAHQPLESRPEGNRPSARPVTRTSPAVVTEERRLDGVLRDVPAHLRHGPAGPGGDEPGDGRLAVTALAPPHPAAALELDRRRRRHRRVGVEGHLDVGASHELLLEEVAEVDPTTARFEVDRYLGWPGQALAFKVGARLWQQVRSDAAGVDLKTFHMAALGLGPMGLAPLRTALVTAPALRRPKD